MNIVSGRLVLALESPVHESIKYIARFAVGGHCNNQKDFIVHSSRKLQAQVVRLLLAVAVICGADIWTTDMHYAYLQSAISLLRDIFVATNAEEFALHPNQCLKQLRPSYGLSHACDLWYEKLVAHCKDDVVLKTMQSDQALRYLENHCALHRICKA